MIQLHYYIAFAGLWALGNGILHDVFVLLQRRPYDRDLIRLLIDGHILIFAGILYLLSFPGIRDGATWAYVICFTNSIFMLGYCAIIFKMLPSIGTILVNAIVLLWVAIGFGLTI
jgi:hypothetical protein